MFISEKQIEVRYAETDQMGVVYHANYIIWCEIGRSQLVKDLGFEYAQLERDGFLSPVLDFSVQYKAAMRYGQTATIRTWIESHSRLRTTYGYEILHEDGTVAATATSVHTLVKKENFRPIALSKISPEWEAAYVANARKKADK
ncbi:thioesterase family protein [Solibacillus sp. CAU 1738]|uniref:acyl-CoA thioesterase n=1 Tax=Solibacillus sp. CAU 1738 TaxID=3140363 RepID=UPI00326036AE